MTTSAQNTSRRLLASALLPFAFLLVNLSPQAALAQDNADKAAKAGAKTTAKPASKPAAKTPAKPAAKHAAPVAAPAAAALSPEQLNIAQYVNTGRFPCELGGAVTVSPVSGQEGHFTVSGNGRSYNMVPVPSATGAVRLEDKRTGGVWLVLANKSMLLDQRQGQRVADECQNDQQRAVTEQLKTAPPPSILDAPAAK